MPTLSNAFLALILLAFAKRKRFREMRFLHRLSPMEAQIYFVS